MYYIVYHKAIKRNELLIHVENYAGRRVEAYSKSYDSICIILFKWQSLGIDNILVIVRS